MATSHPQQPIQNGVGNDLGDTERKDVEDYTPQASHHELDDPTASLSQEHRDYLLKRHGTLDLDPIPSADPADPYNWPAWKKNICLVLVAFHAMMTTFIAAGIIPAFELLSMDLHVSLTKASYLTSAQIMVLGVSPLFWRPLSNRYGRRPIWLISTLGAGVCNIGCANTHSYGAQMVTRILTAFFISPAIALGSGTVVEMFFAKERGAKMGLWTLALTLGPPGGPFIMGFVANHLGWRWIYWILAIINGAQFLGYLFFGPETLFLRNTRHTGSTFKKEYMSFGRLNPEPFSALEFIKPAFLIRYPSIFIPTTAYSHVFCYAGVLLTVEIPQLFGAKFHFNPQQIGYQFVPIIIGSVIGEQCGGPISDYLRNRYKKKHGVVPPPEHRLTTSYFGFLCAIVGLIVFGVRIDQAKPLHWNVTPLIGIGIAAFGNQFITTILVTYAVDCHPEHSASVGVFINLIRSTWGFIGPFWFPPMFVSLGVAGSMGLLAGIVFLFSVIPTAIIQWKGDQWRRAGRKY